MINLEAVRASGSRPRVHGNGFIQLDLTKLTRLHVWGDARIPRQTVASPIHDHVFDFDSTIIVGRLINVIYKFVPKVFSDFEIYVPETREGEDTILKPTGMTGYPDPIHANMVQWRSLLPRYRMAHSVFHEIFAPEPSATIMVKEDMSVAQRQERIARVLVPTSGKPDNKFTRYETNEDLLWRIIEDTLALRRGR